MIPLLRELIRIGQQLPALPEGYKVGPTHGAVSPDGVTIHKRALYVVVPDIAKRNCIAASIVSSLDYTLGCGAPGRGVDFGLARHDAYTELLTELAALPGPSGEAASALLLTIWDPKRPLYLAFGRGVTLDHVQALAGVVPTEDAVQAVQPRDVGPLLVVQGKGKQKVVRLTEVPADLAAYSMALDATLAAHPGIGRGGVEEAAAALAEGTLPLPVVLLPVTDKAVITPGVVSAGAEGWWCRSDVREALAQRGEARKAKKHSSSPTHGTCGLCGTPGVKLRVLFPASGGALLITFNSASVESYGLGQGANAPTCSPCAEALMRGLDRVRGAGYLHVHGTVKTTNHYYWPSDWDHQEPAARGITRALQAVLRPYQHMDWWAETVAGETPLPGGGWHLGLGQNKARWITRVADPVDQVESWQGVTRWYDTMQRRPQREEEGVEVALSLWSPLDVAGALLPRGIGGVKESPHTGLMQRTAAEIGESVLWDRPLPAHVLGTLANIERREDFMQPFRWKTIAGDSVGKLHHLRNARPVRRQIRLYAGGKEDAMTPEQIETLPPALRSAYRLGQYLSGIHAIEYVLQRSPKTVRSRYWGGLCADPQTALIRMRADTYRILKVASRGMQRSCQLNLDALHTLLLVDGTHLSGRLSPERVSYLDLGYHQDGERRVARAKARREAKALTWAQASASASV